MKILMTTTAIVALAVAAPVWAQNAPTGSDTPTASEPAPVPEPGMVLPDSTAPEATESTAPKTDAMTESAPDAASPALAGGKFLTEQDASEVLVSSMIGAPVENAAEESLGDINDVVLSADGSIDGVVIGVGGFLGLGEKNVAVAFDAIDQKSAEDGSVTFVLNATADELEAAPDFLTVAELRQQQEMNAPAATLPTAPAPIPTQ